MGLELHTRRLHLRPLTASDEAEVVRQLGDLAVSRWLTVVPHPYTVNDFRDFLGFLQEDPREGWAIIAPEGLVGVAGCTHRLGYWLGRAHHGKGYMSEAARALVDDHFTRGAERLLSGHFPDNASSARVLEKLGFVPTGEEVRTNSIAQGADVTLKNVILTRQSWEARRDG